MNIIWMLFVAMNWRGAGLTFDDGPTPTSYKIVEVLHKNRIPALFFPKGTQIRQYPDFVPFAISRGFSFGNHTFDHIEANKVKRDVFEKSIEKQHALLLSLGASPTFFRFPSGIANKMVSGKLKSLGYDGFAFWDVFSGDIRMAKLSVTYTRLIKVFNKQQTAVVLFHDCSSRSLPSLKDLIQRVEIHNVRCLFGLEKFFIFFIEPQFAITRSKNYAFTRQFSVFTNAS